jgi:NAD(P)H-hydrate epimerase
MFEPLPTPQEISAWDAASINSVGVRGEILMENASRAAFQVLADAIGSLQGVVVHLLAGGGNNGGDAFCLSRHLLDAGCRVLVFHTKPRRHYKREAGYHLNLAAKLGVQFFLVPSAEAMRRRMAREESPDILVDGLLGTGFNKTLRPDALEMIRLINQVGKKAFVLSLDIPSGLSGLSGDPRPEAVEADATVTFEAVKLGLAMPMARRYTGALHVAPIGMPTKVKEAHPASHALVTRKILQLIPEPTPDMHKGAAGRVLAVGGSPGLSGALQLAGLGALRAGAGLVTAACPRALEPQVKAGLPDLMTMPVGSGERLSAQAAQEIASQAERFDAAAVGPGLGRDKSCGAFMEAVADLAAQGRFKNLLLDADALYWLANRPEMLAKLPPKTVLTPHPGEMARLLGVDTQSVCARRLEAAKSLAAKHELVVVLKGAGTVTAAPDGALFLSPFSEPNLSVGGSGDVLSGVIASLMARGLEPLSAALAGVYWHGMAGRLLSDSYPGRGNLASEIASQLPFALKESLYASKS